MDNLPSDNLPSDYLPGNTILPAEEQETIVLTALLPVVKEKQVIILASNDVNDETLFLNGLTQNIVVLYDQFEALGYTVHLLQNGTSTSERKAFIHRYRTISSQDLIKNKMPISAFIEIGMSIDALTRGYLRSVGAKIVKLYLGNILNIDIETIQNFKDMFFNHHIVGELDEIWTSPHYKQHQGYAAILNRTSISTSRVVPYVWDSCFITNYGTKETMDWLAPPSWHTMDIVIMDPNISFQKCSFYSLLLVEAFSKQYPEWRGKVQVINGDRLKLNANAYNFVLPSLTLFQSDRIVLYARKKIHTILQENRSACFITHQWNNDYNYMTLELMYCKYPILHNSTGWADYGYHYSINEWSKAIQTMHTALTSHASNLPIYKTHATNLIWKHNIHNPAIQERWRKLLHNATA